MNYSKQFGWLFIANFVSLGLGFLMNSLIFRKFELTAIANFTLSVTTYTNLSLITVLCLNRVFVLKESKEHLITRHILKVSLAISLLISNLLQINFLLVLFFSNILLTQLKFIALSFLFLPIISIKLLIEGFLLSKDLFSRLSVFRISFVTLRTLTGLTLVLLEASLFNCLVGMYLAETVVTLISMGLTFLKKKQYKNEKSTISLKNLYSNGLFITIGSLFRFIYLEIDKYLIPFLIDFDSLGIYAVCFSLSNIFYLIFLVSFLESIFKRTATSVKPHHTRKMPLFRLSILTASIVVPLALLYGMNSKSLLLVYGGNRFTSAYFVVFLLVISLIPQTLNMISLVKIQSIEHWKLFLLLEGGLAILQLFLVIFLGKLWGLEGIALARIISYSIFWLLSFGSINYILAEKSFFEQISTNLFESCGTLLKIIILIFLCIFIPFSIGKIFLSDSNVFNFLVSGVMAFLVLIALYMLIEKDDKKMIMGVCSYRIKILLNFIKHKTGSIYGEKNC